MKKFALAISILALVVFYFIPKEHSEIEKFSDKNDRTPSPLFIFLRESQLTIESK
ncbi:hypothetical protein [Pseudoalteromonas sp. Ld19]|uniref:hypothetical protein n=1 Tax=Pseudoalteromonas sp. Ld19 TaxID=649164 RepID=UPI003863B567